MKKVAVIVALLATVLGLSQCRRPDLSKYNNYFGQKETIEFTTNSGVRGQFDPPTASGVLSYKWDIDNSDGKIDRILVFAHDGSDEEITEETKFTGGTYLGAIPIVSVSSDGRSATFKGYLNVPSKGVMRFVHIGQDVSANSDGSAIVDFSTQDGTLKQISNRIVAICDKPYTKIEPFTNCRLQFQYAIAYVDFSGFDGGNVYVFNNVATVLNLTTDGTISYSGPTTATLQGAGSSNGYYFAIMPNDVTSEKADLSSHKYTFYANHKLKDLTSTFNLNSFYTGESNTDKPAIIAPDVDGVIPDLFSVSDTQKVRFSTGNLQYLGKTSTWRFAVNQWDYMGDGIISGNVTLSDYEKYNSTDEDQNAARDLFGWGATGYQDNRENASTYQSHYQPYSCLTSIASSDINHYGYGPDYYENSKYNLTVGSRSDWGYVLGPQKGWRTITEDEFTYLLTERTAEKGNSSKINGIDARYAMVIVNGVKGVMVFPDVFTWPTDVSVSAPVVLNQLSEDWNGCVDYAGTDFAKLEAKGVVFFPTGGQRGFGAGDYGLYWTSSCINAELAYSFAYCGKTQQGGGVVNIDNAVARGLGRSVRLARNQ